MDKTGEKILETTDIRTLWSETLLELLQDAVENQWSAHAIREIVRELQRKGYSQNRLIKLVKKKFDPETARQFGVKAGFFSAPGRAGTPGKPESDV